MNVNRPTTDKPTPKPAPKPPSTESEEDVEGHVMNMPSGMAWDLAKGREREIRQQSSRHTLIAAAKERARHKR